MYIYSSLAITLLCFFIKPAYTDLNEKPNINSHIQELCSSFLGNVVINLKHLQHPQGYEVSFGKRKYILNICGTVPKCLTPEYNDVSVCEIDSDTGELKNILGVFSQHRILNKSSFLRIDYRFLQRVSEIEIRCNRHLTKNKVYLSRLPLGKRIKFVFETVLVCVQQPLYFEVRDNADDAKYHLGSLCKQSYDLSLSNEQIHFSFCGNLNYLHEECHAEARVCLRHSNKKSKNLGVFTSGFHTNEEYLTITFSDGSQCSAGKYIETQIDLKCSWEEKKPKLLNSTDCKYNIELFTPAACPYYASVDQSCIIHNNIFSSRTLKHAIIKEDKFLRYSLCVPLQLCNGIKNASVCVKRRNIEIIYGYVNETVCINNGLITMELYGEKCTNQKFHSAMFKFHCVYSDNREDNVQFSDDNCEVYVHIYNKIACPYLDFKPMNCTYQDSETSNYYDLRPLKLSENNYEIVDHQKYNLTYIINICSPLVYNSNAACTVYSSVCVRNNSEPNLKKKFISLGSYSAKSSVITYKNNSLVLHYSDGQFCNNFNTRTLDIYFKCVDISENKMPILLLETDCYHKFLWETHYACPVKKYQTDSKIVTESYYLSTRLNTMTVSKPFFVLSSTSNYEEYDENLNNEDLVINYTTTSTIEPLISVQNCTAFINNSLLINMNWLPRNINVTSLHGRTYFISLCNPNTVCNEPVCGGTGLRIPYGSRNLLNLNINRAFMFIELNYLGNYNCNDGFYSSVLFLKCSLNEQNPTVLNEDECNVQFEWKTSITCPLFGISSKNEQEANENLTSGTIITISILIPTSVVFVAGIVIFVRRRKLKPDYSLLLKDMKINSYSKNMQD